MKKLSITLALLTFVLSLQAQYFEHLYGTPIDDALEDGKITSTNIGHILTSTSSGFNLPFSYVKVTHTDFNGNPIFNNEYEIYNTGGAAVDAANPKVIEYINGSGNFGVAGMFRDPFPAPTPGSGIFYMELDPAGNPVNVYEYRINPIPIATEIYSVAAIAISNTGNEAYITGSAGVSGVWGNAYVFIIKIDINTGTLMWSNVYDVSNSPNFNNDIATDIIESPFSSDVIVVGHTYESGLSNDAFFFRVDNGTGVPVANTKYHGTNSTWDYFTSIHRADQIGGFVIGGYRASTAGAPADFWVMLVDATGTVITWNYTYDYSLNPGKNDECYDVIERFNTSGFYEYYAAGIAHSGAFGTSDALVVKIDNNGLGVEEYTYGDPNFQNAYKIDQFNGTGADGLCIFGMGDFSAAPIGGSDLFTIKTYFNGLTACNYMVSTPTAVGVPIGLLPNPTPLQLTNFSQNTMSAITAPILDQVQCYVGSVGGGSNARMVPKEPKGEKEAILIPNPMQQGNQQEVIEIESAAPATATVSIYDMLGRTYYSEQHTLTKGINRLPIDLSKTNMAVGMYTVKINGADFSKNIILIVR